MTSATMPVEQPEWSCIDREAYCNMTKLMQELHRVEDGTDVDTDFKYLVVKRDGKEKTEFSSVCTVGHFEASGGKCNVPSVLLVHPDDDKTGFWEIIPMFVWWTDIPVNGSVYEYDVFEDYQYSLWFVVALHYRPKAWKDQILLIPFEETHEMRWGEMMSEAKLRKRESLVN